MLVKSRKDRVEGQGRLAARSRPPCGKVEGQQDALDRTFPQPPAPSPQSPPSGLSLTEVLIAMGILTIGLLGVASVFPVGSFYMQKAEIADKGSAIAQSVMSDILARGMLNPRAWYAMIPAPMGATAGNWNMTFPSDGKYSGSGTPIGATFTRPFGLVLNEAMNQPTAATDKRVLARQFGNAYVIDPLGVSLMTLKNGVPPPQKVAHASAAVFPASAYSAFFSYSAYPNWPASAWSPWSGGNGAGYDGTTFPVRRVTFRQPTTGYQMDPSTAEHFFRGSDDLTVEFPARDDRPGIQAWDTAGTSPMARKWTGDYSWIVTVSPTTNDARNGMATNPEGYAYDVSVVVFYKRPLPESADTLYPTLGINNAAYLSAMGANERAVKASVVSTGLNGGELLLTDWGDYRDASNTQKFNAFDSLRTGMWVMMCGPHPNSSASEPRFALNWYQVLSVEPAVNGVWGYDSTNPQNQRLVSLRGPQWPWQPATAPTDVASDLCIAICKGAVAVHTKTIRLESGHSEVGFSSAGKPTTTQSPATVH